MPILEIAFKQFYGHDIIYTFFVSQLLCCYGSVVTIAKFTFICCPWFDL